MTQTVSFSDRLRKGFTVFKWDLRNCSGALLIFAILATVFAAIVLTLSLTFGIANATEEYTQALDFEKLKDAVMAFQLITTYGIFYLNAVFTIIYTIRIYSYLHNKRKADMYGALPIGRRTFFIAKTVSAYLLSVVPTLFFFGIIAVISLCLGQPLLLETAGVFVQLLIGAIASISFYALLSICCGTTVNAVLAFVAVNFAYPIAALFIKGTIRAFFYGMPTNLYNNSFIMKALNPLAAYEGSNILYWLIFTASCLALAVWLVKKRPAECAQNSFAYYLPAYLVKLLVSFIIGMFLGTVFGGLDVFGFPLIGFIFGFTLGSVPAYLIAHIIFYRGLNRFPRTLIAFGAMSAAVFAAIAFCFFDFVGYTAFVPVLQDVKSAGVVELGDCYYTGKTSVWNIAQMAADDYTDAENIKRVQDYHKSVVANYRIGDDNRFTRVWENMFLSGITSELFSDDSYAVAYKLNNGHTVIRYYSERDSLFDSYSSSVDYSGVDEIVASDTYYRNYSALLNAQTDEITSIAVSNKSYNDFGSSYSEGIHIEEVEGKVSEAQAASDRRKVMEAYRRDYDRLDGRMSGYLEEKTTNPSSADNDLYLHIRYTLTDVDTGSFLMNLFGSIITQYDKDTDMGVISPDCTEAIQALQDVGVLDKDGKIDQNSVYYFKAKNIYEK